MPHVNTHYTTVECPACGQDLNIKITREFLRGSMIAMHDVQVLDSYCNCDDEGLIDHDVLLDIGYPVRWFDE